MGRGVLRRQPDRATAVRDRLLHHISIHGESYRLKEKRKAGVVDCHRKWTNEWGPVNRSTESAQLHCSCRNKTISGRFGR